MIELDGSVAEGGGQILRTALALSTITRQPFRCKNIRKHRSVPGLKAQHLACISALQQWTHAKIVGNTLGSDTIEFFPQETIPSKNITVKIGTAGSICLVLQSLLLPALFAEGKVKFSLHGGTDVPYSPGFDFFSHVFLPHIRKFCKNISCTILRRGFFPVGNGHIELLVTPFPEYTSLTTTKALFEKIREISPPINLPIQSKIDVVKGNFYASKSSQKTKIVERQLASVKTVFSQYFARKNESVALSFHQSYVDADCDGGVFTFWGMHATKETDVSFPVTYAVHTVHAKENTPEIEGRKAVEQFITTLTSENSINAYLADQLLVYMALIGGCVPIQTLSPHMTAVCYVIEKFLGKKPVIEKNMLAFY